MWTMLRRGILAGLLLAGAWAGVALVQAVDGDLDPSFDGDGKLIAAPVNLADVTSQGPDYLSNLALQDDGKLVVSGYSVGVRGSGYVNVPVLARFNSDGSPDLGFGVQGVVTASPLADVMFFDVAILPDARLVAVGRAQRAGAGDGAGDLVVARFTTAGSPDPAFGGTGWITMSVLSSTSVGSIALQPDQSIVLAGYAYSATNSGLINLPLVVRLQANGAPDPSFDGDGIVVLDLGDSSWSSALALQADGKLLVAGTLRTFFNTSGPHLYDAFVVRLNADGSLDSGFGSGGLITQKFLTNYGVTTWASDLKLQADGKIVLAGGTTNGYNGGESYGLARYTSSGELDPTFGGDGVVTGTFMPSPPLSGASAMVIQGDGAIVVAGTTGVSGAGDFGLARHLPNGSLDLSFSGDGVLQTDFATSYYSDDRLSSLVLQPDGKIVAGGSARFVCSEGAQCLALARYLTPVALKVYLPLVARLP